MTDLSATCFRFYFYLLLFSCSFFSIANMRLALRTNAERNIPFGIYLQMEREEKKRSRESERYSLIKNQLLSKCYRAEESTRYWTLIPFHLFHFIVRNMKYWMWIFFTYVTFHFKVLWVQKVLLINWCGHYTWLYHTLAPPPYI